MQDLQPFVLDVFLVLILAVDEFVVDELIFLAGQLEGLNSTRVVLSGRLCRLPCNAAKLPWRRLSEGRPFRNQDCWRYWPRHLVWPTHNFQA